MGTAVSMLSEPNENKELAPNFGNQQPSQEFLDDLAAHSQRLESATPGEILQWTIETYYPKLTMATAFGPEGCVIMHHVAQINSDVPIFNLETGYQFEETHELRDCIAEKYGIEVEYKSAETTVEEYESLHGGPLHGKNPAKCCHDRKIVVLRKAVEGYDAWMSGIRREEGGVRAKTPIVGWD
ncbi:MAG: phosphoadenosine phosphosulfate reductase family protein, partial [Planctomycetales bacterium]